MRESNFRIGDGNMFFLFYASKLYSFYIVAFIINLFSCVLYKLSIFIIS